MSDSVSDSASDSVSDPSCDQIALEAARALDNKACWEKL